MIIRGAAGLVWWLCVAGLFAWALGRVFTDRYLWSQYCFWLPSVVVVPGVAAGLATSWAVLWWSGPRGPRNPGATRAAVAVILAVVLSFVYVVAVEQRRLTPRPAPASRPFVVVHWNATDRPGDEWVRRVLDQAPDVIVINPATGQVWDALIEQYKPVTKIWQYGFVIFSRHRALRFGYQILGVDEGVGFDPRTGRSRAKRRDPGRAMLLQLDTTAALGAPTTYWLIDLPSDISLHRRVVVEEAAEALRNFDGQVIDFDADGTAHRASRGGRGFPPPDVILGDFNIPRGSGSLARLGADLVPAYSVAGRGMCATWPYERPLWHLDQMLVNPHWRIADYRAFDPGGGTHMGQRLIIDAAK